MLKIMHKGIQMSGPLDPALVAGTGVLWAPNTDAAFRQLIGGRLVAKDANGHIVPADGVSHNGKVLGFLVDDAAGAYFENQPALATGTVAFTWGPMVGETDQITDGITIKVGDALYADTGANAGKITNVAPTLGQGEVAVSIGIADSEAGPSNPLLTVLAK